MTTHAHAGHKAADTARPAEHAAKAHAKADNPAGRSPEQEKLAKGEHVEQKKMNIGEGMTHTGANATLADVGTGSISDLAPAVQGTMTEKTTDRVVQQGDEVIVHGRGIIDGETAMHGLVLKINPDSTIAVRVQRANGQTFDVPGRVHNADKGTGEPWWSFPDKEELAQARRSA